jgi:hypothetical protein
VAIPTKPFIQRVEPGGIGRNHEATRSPRRRAKQPWWYFNSERLCCLEIDHKLELIGQHYRKVARILALENASRINARLPRLGLPVLKRQQRDRFDSALTCWTPGWSRSTGSTIRSAGAPLNSGNGNAPAARAFLESADNWGIGTSVVQRVFRETP